MRHVLLALLLAQPLGAAADVPPIAPAFLAQELLAIGHVGGRPAPGAGTGLGGCSATLITPTIVLTAAHCAAQHAEAPQNLFITFGWRSDGPPVWRGTAARILVSPDYVRGRQDIEALALDLALVILPRPVPETLVAPIPLRAGVAAPSYASYGYLADSHTVLRGHEGCQAEAFTPAVVGFDCDVVSGFSGGPLLAMTADGPVVTAVAVAHARGITEGMRSFAAIPPATLFPDGAYPE